MANYRKRYSEMTGKWTPVAAVGKTLSTRKIAERIEKECTATLSDVRAVLFALPNVLRDEMANGNAVKLDGIGSFALSVQCHKTGVANAADVDPYSQITNVKVQFRPERESILVAGKKKMQTSLVAQDITWIELQEKKGTKNAGGTTPSGGGSQGGGTTPDPGTGGGNSGGSGSGDNPGGGDDGGGDAD